MLGWIIPVAQYVLCIATAMLLVSAAFVLLVAFSKPKGDPIYWVSPGTWSDKPEHWQGADEAHQNGKGGK